MTWHRIPFPRERAVHVVPLGDLRQHEPFLTCWCKPVRDDQEDLVIIHNALDGREKYEEGAPKS